MHSHPVPPIYDYVTARTATLTLPPGTPRLILNTPFHKRAPRFILNTPLYRRSSRLMRHRFMPLWRNVSDSHKYPFSDNGERYLRKPMRVESSLHSGTTHTLQHHTCGIFLI